MPKIMYIMLYILKENTGVKNSICQKKKKIVKTLSVLW